MKAATWMASLGIIAGSAHAEPSKSVVPREYVALRTVGNLAIDGKLDEPSWQRVPWTDFFVQAEGGAERPNFNTRAKFLWDGGYSTLLPTSRIRTYGRR